MPTLVPRRTRRRRRRRTKLRRALSDGCTRCQSFASADPKVRVSSAMASPPSFRARPEGRMFPQDGNADDLPCCPRKSCPVSRRRLLMVLQDAPKGFPFRLGRLAVSDRPRKGGRPQPLPVVPRGSPKGSPFPAGRLAPPYWMARRPPSTQHPEGRRGSPYQHRGGTSRCLHPEKPEGSPGPQRSPKGTPGFAGGRIWQIPQNLGPKE